MLYAIAIGQITKHLRIKFARWCPFLTMSFMYCASDKSLLIVTSRSRHEVTTGSGESLTQIAVCTPPLPICNTQHLSIATDNCHSSAQETSAVAVLENYHIRDLKLQKWVTWPWSWPLGDIVFHLKTNIWYSLPVYKIWRLYLQPFQRYEEQDIRSVEHGIGPIAQFTSPWLNCAHSNRIPRRLASKTRVPGLEDKFSARIFEVHATPHSEIISIGLPVYRGSYQLAASITFHSTR